MKKTLLLILISFMLLIFTACGTPTNSSDVNNNQNLKPSNQLEEIVDSSVLDQNLRNQFQDLAKQRGYTIVELDDQKILFIALGEKNTSGYDLKASNVTEDNESIVITIEEIKPAPTDMVAQVITYPYKLYWLKGEITDITKIKVIDESGKEFTFLDM